MGQVAVSFVMEREADDPLGFPPQAPYMPELSTQRAYPRAGGPLGFCHIHGSRVGATFLLIMPPTEENGNQLGWPKPG